MGTSRHGGGCVGHSLSVVVMAMMLVVTAFMPIFAQEATPAGVSPYVPPAGLGDAGGTIEIDDSSTFFPSSDYAAQQAKLEAATVGNVPPDGP